MNKLKILFSALLLTVLCAPLTTEAIKVNQVSAARIDGQYAGWFRYHIPEDPELYIDCYVYVDPYDPSIVKGVRFHTNTGAYRGATGTSDGSSASFLCPDYPGISFVGTYQ